MAQITVYPDANPETTSVDGICGGDESTVDWSVVQGGAGNYAADDAAQQNACFLTSSGTSNKWSQLFRGIFTFDTSSIPAGATIDSATFGIYAVSIQDEFAQAQSARLVSSAPASNTAFAAGDYDSLGTTALATDIAIAGMSTAAYTVFTLNATGLATITKAGITKFGLRLTSDVTNTAPTWESLGTAKLRIYMADNGSNKPYLTVNYTVPASGAFFAFL